MLNQPHPSLLGHFVSYFVPMSERMFNLQQKADSEGRQSEAKVWSVLVAQIWTGFAGYCHAPPDIKTVRATRMYEGYYIDAYHFRLSRRHSPNSFLSYFTA